MSSEAALRPARELAIRARGLSKVYQIYPHPTDRLKQILSLGRRSFHHDFPAVRDLDLDVYRGETVGLVGRNGSGKSTLLRMVCGTLEPSAGELSVRGHLAPLLTLGAGFNAEFTGRENVFMNASLLGLSEREIRDRLESIREFADVGEFFDQPVRVYSSGMQARLAFAVAIHVNPEILVLDEILAVGDEAFTRRCFAKIQELKRRGSTILFASHSAGSVIALCDRAVLLERGARLLTADPKTVISRYQKLIHAPPDRIESIAAEIRDLDRGRGAPPDRRAPGSSAEIESASDAVMEQDPEDFDPDLAPKSTVHFAERGARIARVCILDRYDRPVNVLRPGGVYTLAYDVEFSEAALQVRFGMMVKLITGLDLAGQVSHLPEQGIEEVEAGTTARVRFRFRAALTPGAYFLNAGVLGLVAGVERYLHRIVDVAMFRVETRTPELLTGRVDLAAGPPEVEFLRQEMEGVRREIGA